MQLLSIFHPLGRVFVYHSWNANKISLKQNFQPQGHLLFLESSSGLGQRLEGNPILCSRANSTVNLKMICLFLSSRFGNKPASHWASSSSQKNTECGNFWGVIVCVCYFDSLLWLAKNSLSSASVAYSSVRGELPKPESVFFSSSFIFAPRFRREATS